MPGHFDFHDLERATIRALMLEEAKLDIAESLLYYSERFNERGHTIYEKTLLEALGSHDEVWLERQLFSPTCFNSTELRAGKVVKVPSNASTVFAQSEFNRFYVRGLCRFALNNPGTRLRVYRARQSSRARPESEAKIGTLLDPQTTLTDLRSRIGINPEFGLPEVMSGLSVEILDS